MLYNKDWKDKTEITLSPAATLLNRCADHLEQYGWCQNHIGRPFAPMCAVGVLINERDRLGIDYPAYMEARTALAVHIGIEQAGFGPEGLVPWNNAKNRTSDEVIAAFRGAAETV